MDDPRFQQFFANPQLPQQCRYEAIRAVVFDGQSLQTVATRFGLAYGTLRNLVSQFRAGIRQGRTPPFSLPFRAAGPRANHRNLAPNNPPLPIADCSLSNAIDPFARASPDYSCSCLSSLNSASIAWCATPAIPARA